MPGWIGGTFASLLASFACPYTPERAEKHVYSLSLASLQRDKFLWRMGSGLAAGLIKRLQFRD